MLLLDFTQQHAPRLSYLYEYLLRVFVVQPEEYNYCNIFCGLRLCVCGSWSPVIV